MSRFCPFTEVFYSASNHVGRLVLGELVLNRVSINYVEDYLTYYKLGYNGKPFGQIKIVGDVFYFTIYSSDPEKFNDIFLSIILKIKVEKTKTLNRLILQDDVDDSICATDNFDSHVVLTGDSDG